MPPTEPLHTHRSSIKETVTQLVIAFVMAFVFRGFVVEAFLIPTGSMAPTLMGAHMRFTGKDSGYAWAVGPWQTIPGSPTREPRPMQGQQNDPIIVDDPMTGTEFRGINIPAMGGDRIFVLKYLPGVFDPARFDCVVFKNPTNPDENYIKRLIGLPGEQVALVHGDVFVRAAPGAEARAEDWSAPGWHIARKPERIQQTLWMPVFSSEYAPVSATSPDFWEPPWIGSAGFDVGRRPTYRFNGNGPAPGVLRWNDATSPIDDFCPYNQGTPNHHRGAYPYMRYAVPDIRLRAGIAVDAPDVVVSAIVQACGHEFRMDIQGATVRLRRRPLPGSETAGGADPADWIEMGSGSLAAPLKPGQITDIEFWHVDQSLVVMAGGARVAYAEYDWTPRERILYATGRSLDELLEREEIARDALDWVFRGNGAIDPDIEDHRRGTNIMSVESEYRRSTARWEFSGPVTMHRVGLERDLYYQATVYATKRSTQPPTAHTREAQPAMATHPAQPALLRRGQFFVCGDNSAASLDARLWDVPDPWIAATIDPTIGVVPRDLLIGKAFFVYFPAMHRQRPVPVPDFGRMRFIW